MGCGLERGGVGEPRGEGVGFEGRLGAGFGGEADDEEAEDHDGDDVDAAFGAVDAAGEEGIAGGVGLEEAADGDLPLSGTP